MIRVVNTAPLIFLEKLDRLEVLRLGGAEVCVPNAVIGELRAKPDDSTARVEGALQDWLMERSVTDPGRKVLIPDLGPGEVEVLLLAQELRTVDVVLDDQDARRLARRLGLHPIGTLGLLLAARRTGMIESLRAEIGRLADLGFRANPELITAVLREAGEGP